MRAGRRLITNWISLLPLDPAKPPTVGEWCRLAETIDEEIAEQHHVAASLIAAVIDNLSGDEDLRAKLKGLWLHRAIRYLEAVSEGLP